MPDHSHLDSKYFVDRWTYNCPFCNRRNVQYDIKNFPKKFDWSDDKECWIINVECSSCSKISMHLTYEKIVYYGDMSKHYFDVEDIDSHIFYSVPTSFFTVDSRVPKILRELISEAEGCRKMNYLTGASACTRKAIYELLVLENANGEHYEDRIKSLQDSYSAVDGELFEILAHIQAMTSEKVHEQSWDKWDSGHLKLFLETLKAVLHEIYVVPSEKGKRSKAIRELKAIVGASKNKVLPENAPPQITSGKGDNQEKPR